METPRAPAQMNISDDDLEEEPPQYTEADWTSLDGRLDWEAAQMQEGHRQAPR